VCQSPFEIDAFRTERVARPEQEQPIAALYFLLDALLPALARPQAERVDEDVQVGRNLLHALDARQHFGPDVQARCCARLQRDGAGAA